MKLTEKCKEDFERWFTITEFDMPNITHCQTSIQDFYSVPQSMQYGVYVIFFLNNKMYLSIKQKENLYSIYIDWNGHHLLTEYINFEELHEARAEAIKKANEIYNNK